MDARRGNLVPTGLWVGVLLCLAPLASAEDVEVIPLTVQDGHCDCVVSTARPDDKFFLIVGSLDATAARHRIVVRTRATPDPVHVSRAVSEPTPDWIEQVRLRNERLVRARQQPPDNGYAASADPPPTRTFYVFVGEQDFHDSASYADIKADLGATGRHCCVYLDQSHPEPKRLDDTIKEIVRTFDDEIWPKSREHFGRVADVDRDGRFTILLTGVLDRLQNGKTSLGGFVRGSDFYRDLRAPFGNRCDMMFLNTDVGSGPHLRNLLAHEFTHAVIFSEHVLNQYLPDVPRQDEESWLNEGLAHLAEDMHGYGWSNLDFRVSAFLSAPERYPLVVTDYYRAGLWRTPGIRGACYLFVRWCADEAGPDFASRMTRTNLNGVANLETTLEKPFADLFRRWSVGLLLNGSGLGPEDVSRPRRVDPRRPLGDRLLCGPRFEELTLDSAAKELTVNGTSTAYVLLHSPAGNRCRVEVSASSGAELQVTLVRQPSGMGRLSLRGEQHGDGFRLAVKAHDSAVTLTGMGWERLVPGGAKEPAVSESDWFGRTRLASGEEILSRSLTLDKSRPLVFKVSGIDAAGRRLAAWTILSE